MPRPIRVVVVDDSALMRDMQTGVLSNDPENDVVGTAADPFAAREAIKRLNPDVLTLDVEMPGMNGISFLEKLMALRPMPVVMVSRTMRCTSASSRSFSSVCWRSVMSREMPMMPMTEPRSSRHGVLVAW